MSVKLSAGLPERFDAILKQVEKSLLNLSETPIPFPFENYVIASYYTDHEDDRNG